MNRNDYEHSRPLDVHRWSDHPEVNAFVDDIFNTYFKKKTGIRKKHLKVVLLDLYVAWKNDPTLSIGVAMSPKAYKAGKSRNNSLNIKRTTIDIVKELEQNEFIRLLGGKRISTQIGYVSRIWASDKLIKKFQDATFFEFALGHHEGKETIILRDSDKNEIDTYIDNTNVKRMRLQLTKYNKLLEKSFIDIQKYDVPRILIKPKRRRRSDEPKYVNISHHDKFVRRVFNNSSFDEGGRFYGGWWQRIDGKIRKDIRINNIATVEIDYSAIHVIMLYALMGIDYWSNFTKDPYDINIQFVNDPEHSRTIIKSFLLLAINANNENSLFKAFRNEHDYESMPYEFTDERLSKILDEIKKEHHPIAHKICSGEGIKLMNYDSMIVEHILDDFIKRDTAILSVHDSFVVQLGEENRLHELMQEAFDRVMKVNKVKVKYNKNMTKQDLYSSRSLDCDYFIDMFYNLTKGSPTNGYKRRMERHNQYYNRRNI
ncbi:hypothetical protein OAS37_07045 [Alphaproteobacteria bacterium]|nr:hypothetical protein [Alphaproteobacteria bacterium]